MDNLGVETRPEGGIYLHLTTPTDFGSLSEAASAFERSLASGKHGKVVVRVRGESIADNYVPAAAAIAY